MATPFEQEYFETLQAIEASIFQYYESDPDLMDFHVDKTLDALVRHYTAIQRGKEAPRLKLGAKEGGLFISLKNLCELYLGNDPDVKPEVQHSVDEIIKCLKRILRSVRLMADRGRRGYLDFITQFFSPR